MDPLLIGLIAVIVLVILMLMRVPIGISLMLVGFIGLWTMRTERAAFMMLINTAYNTVSNFTLIAVPLFIIMGFFALAARLPDKAYAAGFKVVGHLPGGLAMASSLGCGAFAAATGSSAATAATIGKVAIPEMRKYGYDPGFACAAVAGGGSMGILIPPSIPLIIYGMITELSIGKLLIAGIIPGLLTIIANMSVSYVSALVDSNLAPRGPRTTLVEKIKAFKGLWGLSLLVFIVMGGIYSGMATPTEAAALGALMAFIMAFPSFIKDPQSLIKALLETAITTSMVMIIMIGASLLTYFLSTANVPSRLTEVAMSMNVPPMVTLCVVLLVYIPLGMFLDALSMLIITIPLVFPIITGFGYDGIWLGILLVKMMEIGYVTPPLGFNVFIIHGTNPDVPIERIFGQCLRFIAADVAVLLLCLVFPILVTFFPGLVG